MMLLFWLFDEVPNVLFFPAEFLEACNLNSSWYQALSYPVVKLSSAYAQEGISLILAEVLFPRIELFKGVKEKEGFFFR